MSESSASVKRFDPGLLGTKSNFTIMAANSSKNIELFFVEIKPNKTSNALVSEDLIFLGKMMKSAIDKSIKNSTDEGFRLLLK